jgi:hypothetical protein
MRLELTRGERDARLTGHTIWVSKSSFQHGMSCVLKSSP